jgi:hypothetical protein
MSVLPRQNRAKSGQNWAGLSKARFEYLLVKIDVPGKIQPPDRKVTQQDGNGQPWGIDGLYCFETFLNVM